MITTKTSLIKQRRSVASLPSASSSLDDLGGEPLDGSGFETEKPEPGFTTDAAPLPTPADLSARRGKQEQT